LADSTFRRKGQAQLLKGIGVFDIRAEEIADDGASICLSQDLLEHFGAARFVDPEEAEQRSAKDPYPVFDLLILPAGFIDVQDRLGGDVLLKFLIRCGQSFIDTGNRVTQMASRRLDSQNLATERLQSAVGGMQRSVAGKTAYS